MLPCNTIAVFNGYHNRKYYQIHPQIGTRIFNHQYILYDSAFPLDLALSIRNENDKVGHDYCTMCRINGTYNNIAFTLCNTCIEKYPEYRCSCAFKCIQNYIERCNANTESESEVKECSPTCVWFGSRGFYRNVDFKTVGMVYHFASTGNVDDENDESSQDTDMDHDKDESSSSSSSSSGELEEGEIVSEYDSDISNFESEF
jgi:hypothetical protein